MKKESIFIPLITYMLGGLLVIRLCELSVNVTFFVIWAMLAGLFYEIRFYFSNRAVDIGTGIYAAGMIIWFAFFVKEDGRAHAVLLLLGFAAVYLLRYVMKWRIIRVLSGFLGLGAMVYFAIMGEDFSKGIVCLALILFLNSVSEMISLFYSGNAKSLIIIYVAVAVLTLFAPVKSEPYGWDFVVRMIDSFEEMCDRIVTEINYRMMDSGVDGIFHFMTSGYSDSDSDPSLSVWESDIEQLMLYGDYTMRNTYLKGNVSGSYTQNGWKNQENFSVPDYRIDTLMTLYVIFRETDDITELNKFMDIKKQEIGFRNIKTESLFYPVKLLDISADNMVHDGDSLRCDNVNGRGYTYSYCFVDLDYSSKFLSKLLKSCDNITYEKQDYYHIYDVLEKNYGLTISRIPFEDFVKMASQYEQNVQSYYVGEDFGVSERTALLSEEIAGNCETVYESCRSLEKYLYQYNYNHAVSFPENVNMTDYFLFEGKEGYCVHYATALAVMLHCRNIPARVAEGFLVDYKNRLESNTYSISSNKAHVWVEAYIKGFGWIRLEPTVVNALDANSVWYIEETDIEDIAEEETEYEIPTEESVKDEVQEKQSHPWLMLLKLFGGMVLIVGIILTVLYINHRIAVKKSTNPDIVCGYLISLLGRKYTERKESETLFEYFERLQKLDKVPDEIKDELPFVQKIMEEYWYGNKKVQDVEINRMKHLGSNI